jgi:hypothetical protein
MADIADVTGDRAELEEPYLLAASKKPSGPIANGACHYCGERLPEPMRWCDAECRSEWEHLQRRGRG